MTDMQRLGATAAFVHSGLAAAALLVALLLIGPAALSEPDGMAQLAMRNPAPFVLQDLLKLATAATSSLLILAWRSACGPTPRLRPARRPCADSSR